VVQSLVVARGWVADPAHFQQVVRAVLLLCKQIRVFILLGLKTKGIQNYIFKKKEIRYAFKYYE
jgi:hypothetical protein